MTLSAAYEARHIYHEDGEVFISRTRLTREQRDWLLDLWAKERCRAFEDDDFPAWRAAADLHGALLKAVLEADSYRREQLPVHKPMSGFGANIFQMFRESPGVRQPSGAGYREPTTKPQPQAASVSVFE